MTRMRHPLPGFLSTNLLILELINHWPRLHTSQSSMFLSSAILWILNSLPVCTHYVVFCIDGSQTLYFMGEYAQTPLFYDSEVGVVPLLKIYYPLRMYTLLLNSPLSNEYRQLSIWNLMFNFIWYLILISILLFL